MLEADRDGNAKSCRTSNRSATCSRDEMLQLTILPLSLSGLTTLANSRYMRNIYACMSSLRQAAGVQGGSRISSALRRIATISRPTLLYPALSVASYTPCYLIVTPFAFWRPPEAVEGYKIRVTWKFRSRRNIELTKQESNRDPSNPFWSVRMHTIRGEFGYLFIQAYSSDAAQDLRSGQDSLHSGKMEALMTMLKTTVRVHHQYPEVVQEDVTDDSLPARHETRKT